VKWCKKRKLDEALASTHGEDKKRTEK
jgi:hypothetical protein